MKLSLVNILEMVFVFIEILFKMLLFKGGVLIYAEHCIPVAQRQSIALAAQRLWVRFPGNTCTDKNMYSLNGLDKSVC